MSAIEAPSLMTIDAIGEAQQLLELGGNDEDRRALRGDVAQDRVDRGARADIDALGRLVENQHLRLQQQPARDDDLLLHAAREIEQVRIGEPIERQLEPLHQLGDPAVELAIAEAEAAMRAEMAEQQILAHRQIRHDRLPPPILGDKADARRGSPAPARGARTACPRTEPRRPRAGAGRTASPRSRTAPRRPGRQARGFRRDADRTTRRAPAAARCRPRTDRTGCRALSPGARGSRVDRPEVPADHQPHEFGLVEARRSGREAATVRPSRMTVISSEIANTSSSRCETKTIAHSRAFESRDHVEQPLDLARAQRGGRLVEDDQIGFERQRLGDLDELALRRGKVARLGVERKRVLLPEIAEDLARRAGAWPARDSRPGRPRSGRKMFSSTERSGARLVSCITIAMPASSASRGLRASSGRPR